MNIIIVNGSPHGKQGNTYVLQEAFAQGAVEAGARVEQVFLREKKIKPCLGCLTCWIKTPGACVIKDDQAELLEKLAWAEAFVLATPLYFDGMTGQAKAFFDRAIPLGEPEFIIVDGHCRHPPGRFALRSFVLISNCGFHELDNFDALVTHCKRMCLNMHAHYAGHLLRPQGPMLAYAKMMPDMVKGVLEAARRAGAELVETGRVSQPTMDAVAADFMTKDAYVQGVNSYWAQEKAKAAEDRAKKE